VARLTPQSWLSGYSPVVPVGSANHARQNDGGLIDVNHVPRRVLTTIPGVDTDMADRILTARERLDGLGSPADLVVHADVPSEVVEAAEESLIFRPD